MQRSILGAVLLVGSVISASTQPSPAPLFADISPEMATSAAALPIDSTVVSRRLVAMRLERLFPDVAAPVLLNVGGHSWIARRERVDTANAIGYRSWVGAIDGTPHSHVSFAERAGVVSGLIDAVSEVFQVRTGPEGLYALDQVDRSRLPPEAEPLVAGSPGGRAPGLEVLSDDPSAFDVLMLYTLAARAREGGAAQIQALVSRIVSDSNTAFSRSGITSRMRLVGAAEFAYAEPDAWTALNAVTNSATARALRDQYRADLVHLLVSTRIPPVCGVAWILNSLSNTNFNAYSTADVSCASGYTPTHEMAHNMGSDHAPEDGAVNGLFPYSYGFKDPSRGFRTVMAVACTAVICQRVLNFSNPFVLQNGGPTGSSTQNNALSINNAAQAVANFRQAATPPSAPTGLRSQVNGMMVTLSWNPVTTDRAWAPSAATSYTLQIGNAPGSSNLFSSSIGDVTSVTGSGPAGTYFWRVAAVNIAGPGPISAEASFTVNGCVPPGAPQRLDFTLNGRVVTLAWTAPASGGAPTTYIIEAGSGPMLADRFNGPTGSTALTQVAQVPPGMYYVRMRAQNACGTSDPSIERLIVVP